MSAYTPPDKIEIYAAALQSDINAERFQVVESGKLKTYWSRHVHLGKIKAVQTCCVGEPP